MNVCKRSAIDTAKEYAKLLAANVTLTEEIVLEFDNALDALVTTLIEKHAK